jgi:hypothetical protein
MLVSLRNEKSRSPGERLLDVRLWVSLPYDVEATPSTRSLGTPQICTSHMETRDCTRELSLP